jgi:hypothetical protein
MEAVRDVWTDERLDDLNHRVDEGFKEMRSEFRGVRADMREEFGNVRAEMGQGFGNVRAEVGQGFGSVRSEMGGMRSELSAQIAQLHRTILQLFGGMMVTFVVGIVAILTQL